MGLCLAKINMNHDLWTNFAWYAAEAYQKGIIRYKNLMRMWYLVIEYTLNDTVVIKPWTAC